MNLIKRINPLLPFLFITLFIAGLLDIKFKGLVYQLLPQSVQSRVDSFFIK
ncbi:hypothetical protein [Oceanobacillus piezotolerans]|uniref:hypothetical protein n=1 Tax=Oceanobacillus piezotolerans TaxID=2448030 RepID=UPI001656A6FD|nr:hypothetical protein [Oceanobacillus piezotolerans]